MKPINGSIRFFPTGATRDIDHDKLDYEGFLSPLVLESYARYMHANRSMADGSTRDSDNWQKGIPAAAYVKSMWRHMMDVWKWHRNIECVDTEEHALCALIFNASGKLHELLSAQKKSNGDDGPPSPFDVGVTRERRVDSRHPMYGEVLRAAGTN